MDAERRRDEAVVEESTALTARQAIWRVAELMSSGADEAAIAYWREVGPAFRGRLDADEFATIGDLMASAEMALSLSQATDSEVLTTTR